MKVFLLPFFACLFCAASAQNSSSKVAVKWAPTGLAVGSVSLQGEYNFMGKNSLTAKIGVPANSKATIDYNNKTARFDMKATSFLAGYRRYLGKRSMRGLYAEPFFHYVHHIAEGRGDGTLENMPVVFNFTNDYDAYALGIQLGSQFRLGKHVLIDLFFLGPQLASARNNFIATEQTTVLPWSRIQEEDARRQVTDFINEFPIVRNKTDVAVDRNNKTVRADFKGLLPGVRAGVSVGIAF